MKRFKELFVLAAIFAFEAAPAMGQEAPPPELRALAKQLLNPVANLTSVPFQFNWDGGVGPDEDTRFLLNVHPVMPFPMGENWNLIARVNVPILSQPALVPKGQATFGMSDILFSAFFSPAQPGVATWGLGPAVQLPVSTDPYLGTERWSAGPTFVILKQAGPWTVGTLANHLWSFAGDDDRADVNQTYIQPFLAYITRVTLTLNTESSANWEAESGQEWTAPINFTVSKVLRLGRRPISVAVGGGYYVEQPDGGPEWKFRTATTLLFPR